MHFVLLLAGARRRGVESLQTTDCHCRLLTVLCARTAATQQMNTYIKRKKLHSTKLEASRYM